MNTTATSPVSTYTSLQAAYDHFNRELFVGQLPPCLITMLSVTVGEGTTCSAKRGPVRNDCVSAAWYRPLVGHGFSQELT